MKTGMPSLTRRRLVAMAALAGAVAPHAVLACSVSRDPFGPPTVAEVAANPAGDKLRVSGRVVGADCKALPGAVVEVWHEGAKERFSVTTDASGRFTVTTTPMVHGRVRPFKIRVSHAQRRMLA